ncbi:hypothetical protein Efla_003727 [Eimeria flavescens]
MVGFPMTRSQERVFTGGPQGSPRPWGIKAAPLAVCCLLFWVGLCEAIVSPSRLKLWPLESLSVPRVPIGALSHRGPHGEPLDHQGAPSSAVKSLRGGGLFGGPPPGSKKEGKKEEGALRRAPSLLTLAGPHDSDVVAVYVHPKRARLLQLHPGQPVVLRGRRRRKTAGVLIEDSSLGESEVSVHPRVFKHLKLVEGDVLLLEKLQGLVPAARVYVQVFKDSLPLERPVGDPMGAPQGGGPERGGPLVGPEVQSAVDDFFRRRPRPVRVGDQFKVALASEASYPPASAAAAPAAAAAAREVEVKVMRLQAEDAEDVEFGIVSDGTEVLTGREPIDSDTYDSASEVTYDDLGGLRKEVKLLREFVELPLRFPDVFRQMGIATPRGVLLHGASGVGKTLLARAVATECGANFIVVNGPEVMSRMAGETEANLRRVFEEASAMSPCLVFIDEIDSIATKRDKTQGDVEKRLVAQLLTLMDGIGANKNVVVLAATNRPNQLDPALRRFGRFDREIEIPIPDAAGRLEILKKKTQQMRLKPDVDLARIAADSHGFVGADLAQLCLEAAMLCLRDEVENIDFDRDTVDPEVLRRLEVGQEHFLAALGVVNPSALRERHVEVPNVRWADIGGLEEVKRELKETVQYPVEHAAKFREFGLRPSRGVLFYGPPGCGKTLLAKAVANECKANFISVKGPELLTMWFGESEANVRDLFDRARAAAPCIIFFDEIDSIAKTRGGGGGPGSEASDRVINQILTEIDGIGKQKQIFIIGATNRPDILDPAVTRPGRLDQLLYIPLPDRESRESIFAASLRKAPLAKDVDLKRLADSTEGFSGADIAEFCQRAAKLAIRESIEAEAAGKKEAVNQITRRHFDLAAKDVRRSVPSQVVEAYEAFKRKYETGDSVEMQIKPAL